MENAVFWDVRPCGCFGSLEFYLRLGQVTPAETFRHVPQSQTNKSKFRGFRPKTAADGEVGPDFCLHRGVA
jgi:hypothetical protein